MERKPVGSSNSLSEYATNNTQTHMHFYLKVLVYSKDRPFQLQQLLKTLLKYGVSENSQIFTDDGVTYLQLPEYFNIQLNVAIFVLYTYSDQSIYQPLYNKVIEEYQSKVNFIKEEDTLSQLKNVIYESIPESLQFSSNNNIVNFFSFMVDDMIFFREFKLTDILFKLYSDHQIYAVHLKLYPGIVYSHTQDKLISNMPKFQVIDQTHLRFLKYRRSESEMDWNYPFDFCGSLYRLESVIDVVDGILNLADEKERNKILKPNSFEYIGNVVIKRQKLCMDQQYCMCLNNPVMTVITINKVQDVYQTPVYQFKVGKQDEESKMADKNKEEEDVLDYLNQSLLNGDCLDIENYYAVQQFNSVHIGDFVLYPKVEQTLQNPKVAVIMSVYNDAMYLGEAIKSILNQTYKNFVFIIVNDGSTNPDVATIIKQHQKEDGRIHYYEQQENQGIASALNYSIQKAKQIESVEFIARMDADDISLPSRLQTQAHYMLLNKDIEILGCNVQIYGERRDLKVVCFPLNDHLIKYNMLYYCAVAHPTLMIRLDRLKDKMIYDKVQMEDYQLWLNLSQQESVKFANLGQILLKLRKHDKNKSNSHTLEDEAGFKINYLINFMKDQLLVNKFLKSPLIIHEFITITGREIKSQDVFKNLKHKPELTAMFDNLQKYFQQKEDIPQLQRDQITKNIGDRKMELAMYAVANDLDTDMLKCLLAGGKLKQLMGAMPKQ